MGFFRITKSGRRYRKGYSCKRGHVQKHDNDFICVDCGEAVSNSVVYGHWESAGLISHFLVDGVKSVESLR